VKFHRIPNDELVARAADYPVVYKVEVTRQDLGLSVKFWARLTSTKNRPAVLRALDDAILELTAIRQEVSQ
jgi:hypothetical protein